MALSFGMRSSPAIFNSVAEVIEWVIGQEFKIACLVHYLDGWLATSPITCLAHQQAAILLIVPLYLRIPLATKKVEGPPTALPFLGIILECQQRESRLPEDKCVDLRCIISHAITKEFISQGNLKRNAKLVNVWKVGVKSETVYQIK